MNLVETLVINEPFVKDFCRTQRWAARTRGRVLRAPDWLAYATSVLESRDREVELHDFPAMDWGKDKLRELVARKQPKYVVLDSTTPSIYSDIECAKICKEESDCKVIMVGPHASAVPKDTLESAKGAVDVVARREYDYTVSEIIEADDSGKGFNGLLGVSYLNGSEIKHNADRPYIENLDALPFPAWHHLDLMKYFDGGKLYPYIDMIAGRGCFYKCSFCLWPQVMHGNSYRLRSAKNVVDEMEWDLKNWPQVKKGEIFFEDDTFTVDRERAMQVCNELKERDLGLTWSVNSRADVIDRELFKNMKSAGCRLLLIGFESGVQDMLNKMRKGTTIERTKKFVEAAKAEGLKLHGCFVLGLPGETRETMQQTIKYALDLKLDTLQFSAAVPFPGTEYYNVCKESGLITAKDWSDWLSDGEQASVVDYPGLTRKEINSCVDQGLKSFYLRPGYMMNFLLDTRSPSDLYRKIKGAKNFFSYLISEGKII